MTFERVALEPDRVRGLLHGLLPAARGLSRVCGAVHGRGDRGGDQPVVAARSRLIDSCPRVPLGLGSRDLSGRQPGALCPRQHACVRGHSVFDTGLAEQRWVRSDTGVLSGATPVAYFFFLRFPFVFGRSPCARSFRMLALRLVVLACGRPSAPAAASGRASRLDLRAAGDADRGVLVDFRAVLREESRRHHELAPEAVWLRGRSPPSAENLPLGEGQRRTC